MAEGNSCVNQQLPSELCNQLDGIRETVANLTGNLSDLDRNKKRWLLIGINLHSILSPVLRKYVSKHLGQLYECLKLNNNIDTQQFPNQLRRYLSTYLNYEAINNNNKVLGRNRQNRYDYTVKDSVDLSRLFLKTYMAHFTAFDGSCDSSALLGIIIGTSSSHRKNCAEQVKSQIRNPWAHCDFSEWDDTKFRKSIMLIDALVRSLDMSNQEVNQIISQLYRWNRNGKKFIEGTSPEFVVLAEIKTQIEALVHCMEQTSKSLPALEQRIYEQENRCIPKHMEEKYQVVIEGWRREEKTFTVTRATKYVTSLIEKNNVVVVTGSSGAGKSSIIHHVALQLHSKEKYDIIPIVSSPSDIVQYRDLKRNQVFVIDDICGKNFINEQDLQTWKEQADRVEQFFPSEIRNKQDEKVVHQERNFGQMKILVSCRIHVFKDEKFKSMKMFTRQSVDLQSKEHCLQPKERQNMISKYTNLSECNLQKMDEVMDKCFFFPLLCKMSKGKQVKQLTELFSSPVDSIKNEIKDMIEYKHEDKRYEFCVLVLCVLFPNELDEAYMNPRTTPQNVKVKVKKIVANFRINLKIELERKQLVDTFNRLDGTYIKKTGSVYSIAHDKLYDMIAVTCGQKLVELFIEYSPSSFIAERFKLKSGHNLEQDDSFLYLSDDTEIVYFDRIFRDLKEQDGKSFFYNQQLKDERYKDKVMGYIKEHTDSCKQLFLELDDKGLIDKNGYGTIGIDYTSTPMIEASKIGFYELVKYLISIKCNVNKADSSKLSPWFYCYKNGHVNIVELLITNGGNIQDILCEACYRGDIDKVRMCLERNVDVSQCNSGLGGETPLYDACYRGHIDIVRLLLDRNVDVSQCNSGRRGETPLYGACFGGHIDIVRLLLDRNVDVSQYNSSEWGETPLYGACEGGHIDIVRLLLDRNVDVSQYNSGEWGETPLYGACVEGHMDIVRLLLQNNADPTQRTRWGYTPLDLPWNNESMEQLLRSYIKH